MNMSAYRTIWTLFVILILAPAFINASSVEGLIFSEARIHMVGILMNYLLPESIASILSYPVTALATLLPGTSSVSTAFGNFIWPWIGQLVVFLFLITIDPPFYKAEHEVN
jgi:hypothetical protein